MKKTLWLAFITLACACACTKSLTARDGGPVGSLDVSLCPHGNDRICVQNGGWGFGAVRVGQCAPAELVVRNSYLDRSVSLQAATLEGPGAADFQLTSAAGATLPSSLDDPNNVARIDFQFCPQATRTSSATLVVPTDDSWSGTLRLKLTGSGIPNGPPHCRCPTALLSDDFSDPGLISAITLPSGLCTDADGQYLTEGWELLSSPPNSQASISNGVTLMAYQPGSAAEPYLLRLTATDPGGLSDSCTFPVYARPPTGIVVRMGIYTTNEDFDLHFLSPAAPGDPTQDGGWFDPHNDCSLDTRPYDWGAVHSPDERVIGEETVWLDHPDAGTYVVGLHRACSPLTFANGEVLGTCGTRRFDTGLVALGPVGTMWKAAIISWPDCTISFTREMPQVGHTCNAL